MFQMLEAEICLVTKMLPIKIRSKKNISTTNIIRVVVLTKVQKSFLWLKAC